jgi:hypothetical protein
VASREDAEEVLSRGVGGWVRFKVGLSLFAAHPQDEWWDFDIPAERYPHCSLKRAVRWFRENW